MSIEKVVFGIMVLMGIILISLMISIVVFVAKDAKRLGMNPVMWVLVVIFVPNLLGLVIYLIVRSSAAKKFACYQCGKPVENDYAICPYCKSDLTSHCKGCDQILAPEWRNCPKCGQEVGSDQIKRVVAPKSGLKVLIGLVIALFVVPIVTFIGLAVIGMLGYGGNMITSDSFSTTSYSEPTMEFMAVENDFGHQYDYSSKKFSGTKTDRLKMDSDGRLTIKCVNSSEKGALTVKLLNESEEMVYEFKMNNEETKTFPVKEGEVYIFSIEGKVAENVKVNMEWQVEK